MAWNSKRSGWKRGDWLVIDEESGVTRYASQVDSDFRGLYVTRDYNDEEQPQNFVRPLDDPIELPFTSLPNRNFTVCNAIPFFIGRTSIRSDITGIGSNYFAPQPVGSAEVGCTLVVF